MGIIRFAIDNPVKITVGVILLILFGLQSVFEIPIQLTPDVDKPIITVATRWTGASPQEIETEIIDRQEDQLKNVPGLEKMTSVSSEGEGVVTLEFPVGVDKDVAFRHVSDKLRQVMGYPDEVDEPVVTTTDNEMENTIAWLILSSADGTSVAYLKTFVEEQVKPILERAEGISEVAVYGGLDREIQIEVDVHRLAARGLTFRDLENALRAHNKNISAGTIAQGKRDYSYRTVGEYRSLEQIENTIVAYEPGGPVRIGDVARVIDGFAKQRAFVRSKGRYVIAMPARRETGANVIQTMERLKDQIALVNRDILAPKGLSLELTQVYDETVYINSAISLVLKNLIFGGALAITVLWLFLRSGSATGVIAAAIPISVVGTFLVITLLGRTLNVVMLAGMAFAVGMLVDNSVVVLENIYRHRTMGKSLARAALDGAREVWGAVLAASLTTMAVFLPVIFIQEEVGQLFKDIAIAISAAVGLSLVVSVLVVPTLAARVLHAPDSQVQDRDETWRFGRWVGGLVSRINAHVPSRLLVVIGAVVMSVAGSWWLVPAADYLPAGNENLVFGMIFSPPGYGIDEFKQMAQVVEEGDPRDPHDGIRTAWEAADDPRLAAKLPPVTIAVGEDGERMISVQSPPIRNFFFVAFSGTAFMGCTSADPERVAPLVPVMQRAASRVPGVFSAFSQTSLFGRGASAGNRIELEIRGDNLAGVTTSATALLNRILQAGFSYPRPDPANFALGRPEVQLVPDPERSTHLGLNVRDVGFIVEAFVDGAFVGEYNDHGDKIDMALTVTGTAGLPVEDVGRLPIHTPTGHTVPLNSAVQMMRTTAPQQINHIEEMSAITLSVEPKPSQPLQEAMDELHSEIITPLRHEGVIPASVITQLAGTASKLSQTQRALWGDFRDTVKHPRLFGMPMTVSMLLLAALVAAAALIARSVGGVRVMNLTGGIGAAVLVAGFLVLNPQFGLTVIQSRMILALVITYLLMSGLFESFTYPFIIMFSVPLAAMGGFAGLSIVHYVSVNDVATPTQQFDVLTMLGFVILIGVVVNNAILIVHQALNFMRGDAMAYEAAVARSVQTRTRPIFMTMLTSVIGMGPLVIMTGPGSELYRGLGSVLIGGLLTSTFFTLVVVPAIFTLVLDFEGWLYHPQPAAPARVEGEAVAAGAARATGAAES